MNSGFSPEFERELLDDFYSECDEHLSGARAQLTALERAVHESREDDAALQSLYRCVHSFKGIAGIVGLRAAENLAHAAEDVLRGLTRGEVALAEPEVELLGRCLHRLEQIVTAHRLVQPVLDAAELLAELEQLRPPASTADIAGAASVAGTTAPLPTVRSGGAEGPAAAAAMSWRATFSPSAELDRRGVNINTVRSRLAALGEILSAVPNIAPGGSMAFDFHLALRELPRDLAAWAADGIVLQPGDPARVSSPVRSGAPEFTATAPSHLFIAPSHIVRVDLSRLDELMRITGEMVIHRSRLEERIGHVAGGQGGLQEVNVAFARSLRELREAITRVRLVPVAEIFTRMPFVARDLARDTRKQVRLLLEGQDTEIDKFLVERLKEPLLHLVRNAVSHGIETPAERRAAGKPEEATLRLGAATSGQSVVLQIHDDGRGVDAAKVTARAAALGIPTSNTPTDAELLAILCQPGFSIREEADLAAGRGVGMAVVHNTVRELGGSLTLTTQPGQWTRFTLRLPLTLSIAETFLVSAGDQTCAVPTGFVEEVVQFSEAQVRSIQQAEIISYRDGILPLVRLRRMFGIERSSAAQQPLVVLSSDRGLCGLVVDKIHGQREVVVRAMHDPLIQVPGISGATELGDGRPVLILDPVALSSGAIRPREGAALRPLAPGEPARALRAQVHAAAAPAFAS